VEHRRAAAMPTRRLTRAASVVRAVSADGVRYRLRELSSRYFDVPQRALAALRSRPRSRLPQRWPVSERE
jgi:hypothetical protein